MNLRRLVCAGCTYALLVSSSAPIARAGGLFLFDRGLRPLSRGGAFVAGADDPHALWYNPAGLSESKRQVLVDATSTGMFASYQRSYADGSHSPTVHAKPLPLPIPTLALSHDLGVKDITFGAGLFPPSAVLLSWPRSLESNGMTIPGPTRYSLITLEGSALATIVVGLAWSGIKGLSLGADAQVLTGRFKAELALSACGDGVTCNFPEDPAFDVYATMDAFPVYGFTGAFGAKYVIADMVRIGVSAVMPYVLRGSARLKARLPRENPLLENAYLDGDRAAFSVNMPLTVRAGVEVRPLPAVRIEAAFAWEQWSVQKELLLEPENVTFSGLRGIGDYQVGPIALPRAMHDTWSVRTGVEAFLGRRIEPGDSSRRALVLRAGVAYEKGAFDHRTLTPLTLDVDKLLLTGGLGFHLTPAVRIDAAGGWYNMRDTTVTDSMVERPQALRPPSSANGTTLGNGRYVVDAFYVGLGLAVRLE